MKVSVSTNFSDESTALNANINNLCPKAVMRSCVASPKIGEGQNVWLEASNSIFAWDQWDAASQSTQWLDMPNIWGNGPLPPPWLRLWVMGKLATIEGHFSAPRVLRWSTVTFYAFLSYHVRPGFCGVRRLFATSLAIFAARGAFSANLFRPLLCLSASDDLPVVAL